MIAEVEGVRFCRIYLSGEYPYALDYALRFSRRHMFPFRAHLGRPLEDKARGLQPLSFFFCLTAMTRLTLWFALRSARSAK
jgi:hypothetical protein